uniref:Beta_helix domain-containing protein n=1 Tax=Steinernema glaseri TaxID=37863 RepID=A0A1I7YG60_9BILA
MALLTSSTPQPSKSPSAPPHSRVSPSKVTSRAAPSVFGLSRAHSSFPVASVPLAAPMTPSGLRLPLAALFLAVWSRAENSFVLVPHGHAPDDSQRVVIPSVPDGPQPPFPCILADSGTHEHGQTFTKGNFHYKCNNGTSEVIACVSDDASVIQIGRTFIRNGVKHKCNVNGETVTYEQESTCFENGIHYNIGESFRNGSFKLVCRQNGIAIDGCYAQNASDMVIPLGTVQVIGNYRHNCELLEMGRVRYAVNSGIEPASTGFSLSGFDAFD